MDYTKKKTELNQKFELKKTNFLNTLFALVGSLQTDLNDLNLQYKEVEEEETKKEIKK